MCNDYEQRVSWADYCQAMRQLELGIPARQSETDLPQADDIRVNDTGPVMRLAGNGVELVPMTFGFPPKGPRGGPVFNFKSEGRRFDKSNRCLIPASAFFEFTGNRYPRPRAAAAARGSRRTRFASCGGVMLLTPTRAARPGEAGRVPT